MIAAPVVHRNRNPGWNFIKIVATGHIVMERIPFETGYDYWAQIAPTEYYNENPIERQLGHRICVIKRTHMERSERWRTVEIFLYVSDQNCNNFQN